MYLEYLTIIEKVEIMFIYCESIRNIDKVVNLYALSWPSFQVFWKISIALFIYVHNEKQLQIEFGY